VFRLFGYGHRRPVARNEKTERMEIGVRDFRHQTVDDHAGHSRRWLGADDVEKVGDY